MLTTIYNKLPFFLQNFSISVFGFFWQKRRFGGDFAKELDGFKLRDSYSNEQWENYQTIELRKILVNAFLNVPFYTDKYSKAGFTLSDFENFNLDDLHKLPYLEKDELRKFGKTSLMSINFDKKGQFFSSSGSTGTPTSIYYSKKMHQKWTAGYEVRVKNWAGVSKNMVRGMVGGRKILPKADSPPPYFRYNFFEKMVYFSAYHISKANVKNYVHGIKKHHVEFMMGYAMSNYFLARFINENKIDTPILKAVITSSEKLTDEMRIEFKRAYGCDCFDTWSGVEACAQISECERHGLHESPDIGIIEVLNEDGVQVGRGEVGEAICTSLINFNQPLIRYKCGDLLKLAEKKCECSRSMRQFSEIIGRVEDVVIALDGREMVRFHGIFIGLPNVIKGQIIQIALDEFLVKIICSDKMTGNEFDIIRDRMISQLGKVKIEIMKVNEIDGGSNGKFKAVVSNIVRDK